MTRLGDSRFAIEIQMLIGLMSLRVVIVGEFLASFDVELDEFYLTLLILLRPSLTSIHSLTSINFSD